MIHRKSVHHKALCMTIGVAPKRGLVGNGLPLARLVALAIIPVALLTMGCVDVSRYETQPGTSYCGSVLSADFVRHGFSDDVTMRLQLQPQLLQSQPGQITTSDGLFDSAELRPLPWLVNDELALLEFGQGRIRNVILGAQPSRGGTALIVLSLMNHEKVEIRAIRGAPPTDREPPSPYDSEVLFGVFLLSKEQGTCGF